LVAVRIKKEEKGLEIKRLDVFRELGGAVTDDIVKIAKSF
jgi:hypothetical protein